MNLLEQLLKERVTKDPVQTYEVVSIHKGFRDFMVFYPSTMKDPFYKGFWDVVDILESQGIYFTLYPYLDDSEFMQSALKNNSIIREVIL